MTEAPTLAELLAGAMADRGLTRYEDLAAALEVTQPTVSKWMNGEPPGEDKIERLAAFLGVSDDEAAGLVHRARKARRERRGPVPPPTSERAGDDIELDYNAAIARMPDHVRRAVEELARPYLED